MSRVPLGRTFAACAVVMAAASTADASVLSRIERHCTVSWQNAGIAAQDWGDCTQDAFIELMQRVSRDRWRLAVENPASEERRELNRLVWCIVKRWQRAPRPERLGMEVPDPQACPAQGLLPEEWSALFREAKLSTEQSRIVQLWSEGTPVAEIASTLRIPACRVSDQKFKALQKLRSAYVASETAIS